MISQHFSSVIEAEGRALRELSLDPAQVETAVLAMLETDYPIILTGVGKSGLVARKIVATLCSLGMPALFLDPTGAAHGDLGVVRRGAVVIALSNGGASQELLALLPSLAARGVRLIAIVGARNSPLAAAAAVLLCYGKVSEADQLGLAPTTTTILQMAIGDGLAVAASTARGLTAQGFSENHPAGLLGRRVAQVSAVMRTGADVPIVASTATFAEVVDAISEKRIGLACVVDEHRRLLGIVSDGDIRAALRRVDDPRQATAETLMKRNPETVAADLRVGEVLADDLGLARHLSLPVVSSSHRLEGVLVAIDLLG